MKKCAKCGKENIDKAIYCANCGAKLDSNSTGSSGSGNKCPKCGRDNLDIATYCDFCGARLGTSPSSGSLNSQSSSKSSTKQSTINQNKEQAPAKSKTDEGPDKLKVCCCYVPVILFIVFMIAALIYHGYAESFPTEYDSDFNYLDLNGDGLLSFNEASQVDLSIPNSTMSKYFSEADTNNNGYLKGHEFDLFASDIRYYYSGSSSSSSDNDKFKYSDDATTNYLSDDYGSASSYSHSGSSSSSSSSSSHNDDYDKSSEGYVLTCPYCGSEAIYETGGYYRCAECGSSIYNPDDLELAYQEGYMDLLVPVLLNEV